MFDINKSFITIIIKDKFLVIMENTVFLDYLIISISKKFSFA